MAEVLAREDVRHFQRLGGDLIQELGQFDALAALVPAFAQLDHIGQAKLAVHGLDEELLARQGRAFVVSVYDGNKEKTVVARPEHLRPIE